MERDLLHLFFLSDPLGPPMKKRWQLPEAEEGGFSHSIHWEGRGWSIQCL